VTLSHVCLSIDITTKVFGDKVHGQPAAFGDFDSDELTDMFVLNDNGQSVEIMFGSNVVPYLVPNSNTKCKFNKHKITSVVPGDFNGDALMDLLVTVKNISYSGWSTNLFSKNEQSNELDVHILWGGLKVLNCSNEDKPLFTIIDQPLVINYDKNMIVDLFGVKKMPNGSTQRTYWLFNSTGNFTEVAMEENDKSSIIRVPQSHGFVDLGGGELYIILCKN